ncbi:MAG: GNAT family N-acetyltransferase [Nitriliruptorales bacterium]|nr:GNAT family N-acetyltransferase [Nitriliruptorales bacterium]
MSGVDDLEIRPVTEDEFPEWARTVDRIFGEEFRDERLERFRSFWGDDLSRTMAAFDGGRIVGTNGEWPYEMTLPGAAPLPCAAVTVVSVAHDWRRRGLLTRMMRLQLERVHDRGDEPFAALYASESPIYGRYGYGIGAPHAHYKLQRSWAQLREPADVSAVGLVDADQAVAAFPGIYAEATKLRGGMMIPLPAWWEGLKDDHPEDRDGAGPRFHALLPDRGFLTYRIKPDWDDQGPKGQLRIGLLVATDPEAHAALWQFAFGVDLVGEIVAYMQPADGPLPLMLDYRGRLQERLREGLWLRLVDVDLALAARRYSQAGRLVFEVHDRFCDWNEARWALETDGEGNATCDRTGDEPDLELDVSALAAISLGGVTPQQLALAGRVDERRHGALTDARQMFAVDLAPWNPFGF